MQPAQDNSSRFHGLDALRGISMILGIVLHAALPYVPDMPVEIWPTDKKSSNLIGIIFQFIHIWRMPLFFILAGFFANLVISRKSWRYWWKNRLLRIALPILCFSPLMSLTLPWIFNYGRTEEITFIYSNIGQPWHLWFLWQLLIFVVITIIFSIPYVFVQASMRLLGKKRMVFIKLSVHRLKSLFTSILFKPRFPILLILLCGILNIPTWGELIFNPVASSLYFTFGYSLYRNSTLFLFLQEKWVYYLISGMVIFSMYTILILLKSQTLGVDIYGDNISIADQKQISDLINLSLYAFKIICSILIPLGLIGLAEKFFNSYNPKLRFISDGAYWIYLIHLPIVSFITFYLFKFEAVPTEIKFLTAIVTTSLICLTTYKYFVRSTLIGILLNGKRVAFKSDATNASK